MAANELTKNELLHKLNQPIQNVWTHHPMESEYVFLVQTPKSLSSLRFVDVVVSKPIELYTMFIATTHAVNLTPVGTTE